MSSDFSPFMDRTFGLMVCGTNSTGFLTNQALDEMDPRNFGTLTALHNTRSPSPNLVVNGTSVVITGRWAILVTTINFRAVVMDRASYEIVHMPPRELTPAQQSEAKSTLLRALISMLPAPAETAVPPPPPAAAYTAGPPPPPPAAAYTAGPPPPPPTVAYAPTLERRMVLLGLASAVAAAGYSVHLHNTEAMGTSLVPFQKQATDGIAAITSSIAEMARAVTAMQQTTGTLTEKVDKLESRVERIMADKEKRADEEKAKRADEEKAKRAKKMRATIAKLKEEKGKQHTYSPAAATTNPAGSSADIVTCPAGVCRTAPYRQITMWDGFIGVFAVLVFIAFIRECWPHLN